VLPGQGALDVALEDEEGGEGQDEEDARGGEDRGEGAGLEVQGGGDEVGDLGAVRGSRGVGVGVGWGGGVLRGREERGCEGLDGTAGRGLAAGAVCVDAADAWDKRLGWACQGVVEGIFTKIADADLEGSLSSVGVGPQGDEVNVGDSRGGRDTPCQRQSCQGC